ncbi:MAG: ceramidase domain-containing protein [bacterium]
MNHQKSIWLIIIFSLVVFTIMVFVPRIPQYLSYHQFIDNRVFFGIPNFMDVVSNLPFIIIGLVGSIYLVKKYNSCSKEEKLVSLSYLIFFISIFLTGFGSGYYHLNPNNTTMLWDRLPLATSFMTFLSAIFYERFEIRGFILLLILTLFGAFSIIYWYVTELQGMGDLRPYIIVQFYPMLLISFVLWKFPSRYTKSNDLWTVMVFYAISKAFELADKLVWSMGNITSGHTLKHIFAGVAVYWILRMGQKREKIVCKE